MADYKKYKVGITVKEPWASGITYEQLDYTLWRVEDGGDGCGYIALKDNIGVTPNADPTVWRKATEAGQSIYDLAVKYHHFVGTEEEFEAQYQAALAAANNAAAAASATDAQVQAAEAARISAEQARATAEAGRVSAESGRVAAENDRVSAEAARVSAESARDTAESTRATAETARQSAETARDTAEAARASAELSRAQRFGELETDLENSIELSDQAATAAIRAAETVDGFVEAEAARVEAEQGRVSAENGRVTAEQGRVSAESARATAETARDTAESGRASAETARATAESARATAEEGRASAETARETQASGDHTRAENDHTAAASDHTRAASDHTQAESDTSRAGTDHTTATSDHTTAASDHTQAGTDHSLAETDHTTAASDHTLAVADHTQAASDHTTAVSDHTAAESDHTRAEEDHTRAEADHESIADKVSQAELEEALSDKADISGYYSGMTVGSAENLVGRGSVAAEYQGIRTSAGSEDIGVGAAQIREMMGKSLVWNQLFPATGSYTFNGVSVSYSGQRGTFNGQLTAGYTNFSPAFRGNDAEHQYYFKCVIIKDTQGITEGKSFSLFNRSSSAYISKGQASFIHSNSTPSAGRDWGMRGFTVGDTLTDVQFYVMQIDLTQMFGAGNEPTTVEEFERMFPLPYYEYNEGTIINNEATGIKTVGFNLFNPATGKAVLPGKYSDYAYEYEICGSFTSISFEDYAGNVTTPELHDGRFFNVDAPGVLTVVGGNATDTLVHLVWSGWRNYGEPDYAYEAYWENTLQLNLKAITGKLNGEGESVVIFPDGMRSAGSVYDSLIVDSDGYARKAVKRIGGVDLGTLYWSYRTAEGHLYFIAPAGNPRPKIIAYGAAVLYNLICTKYTSATWATIYYNRTDKVVGIYHNEQSFVVYDSSYTDADTFKAAMSGVMLNYELATYEEYTLDTPIFLGYPVDDFGTEAKLPVDTAALPTGPIRYRVTYPMNAVDPIRRLPTNYISKESMENMLTAMKTAGIIGDYTMTYNSTSGAYTFTITAPSAQPAETTDLNA